MEQSTDKEKDSVAGNEIVVRSLKELSDALERVATSRISVGHASNTASVGFSNRWRKAGRAK